MQKNNNENKEQFIIELFQTFLASELKRVEEAKNFFQEAYILHSADDLFDDPDYRKEWLCQLNWLSVISLTTKKISEEDLDEILRDEIKKRLEGTNV